MSDARALVAATTLDDLAAFNDAHPDAIYNMDSVTHCFVGQYYRSLWPQASVGVLNMTPRSEELPYQSIAVPSVVRQVIKNLLRYDTPGHAEVAHVIAGARLVGWTVIDTSV